jgi:hypothetical protein
MHVPHSSFTAIHETAGEIGDYVTMRTAMIEAVGLAEPSARFDAAFQAFYDEIGDATWIRPLDYPVNGDKRLDYMLCEPTTRGASLECLGRRRGRGFRPSALLG